MFLLTAHIEAVLLYVQKHTSKIAYLHASSETAHYEVLKLCGGAYSLGQTRLRLHFPANREIYREFAALWAHFYRASVC